MTMPSKDLKGGAITTTDQLLHSWNEFLTKKFASPPSDSTREREQNASPDDRLTIAELEECLSALKSGKAPGHDNIPIEAYKHSPSSKQELFRITMLVWDRELIPPDLVIGVFIMFHKKNCKDDS